MHRILFNTNETQETSMTTGLESFILKFIVCPDCSTVIPCAMIAPDTGELITGFDFNV